MGFLNIFKKGGNQKKINNDFDTQEIKALFLTPLEQRNSKWIDRFNILINQYDFEELKSNNFEDKTGMNYLNLTFSNNVKNKIKDYFILSLNEGKGISINGNKGQADWIFTFGEILGYQMNGTLYSTQILSPFGGDIREKYFHNKEVIIGQPSDAFFPEIARIQIKNFLYSMGLRNIRMALILWRTNNRLTLAFEIVPEMFDDVNKELLNNLLDFVKWYLPNHYDTIFIEGDEYFQEM
jgi:hypothetical protein